MNLLLLAAVMVAIAPVDKDAPNRQPRMAASKQVTAIVFGSRNAIWFAASKDEAQSFSKPVKIAGTSALALGRHRGPHVVISGRTLVVSAVYGKTVAAGAHAHGLPADGDLVALRSDDDGVTWSQPVVINDVPAAAREGLHAMASNDDGVLAAAWLDLRAKGTRLYGAYSKDAGQTWSNNVLLFEAPGGTICECCAPSLTAASGGGFEVMFRNVLAGNRDMYVLDWKPGTVSAPRKMGEGSWHLDACPMDGGGVVNFEGKTLTAWRREHTVFLDEAGQKEKSVGEGKDVAIAAAKRGVYISWTAVNGIQVRTPGSAAATDLGKGEFSALQALPNGKVAAAWELDGAIRISVVE